MDTCAGCGAPGPLTRLMLPSGRARNVCPACEYVLRALDIPFLNIDPPCCSCTADKET